MTLVKFSIFSTISVALNHVTHNQIGDLESGRIIGIRESPFTKFLRSHWPQCKHRTLDLWRVVWRRQTLTSWRLSLPSKVVLNWLLYHIYGFGSAVDCYNSLNVNSHSTMSTRRPLLRTPLTPEHKMGRLRWNEERRQWHLELAFSDESLVLVRRDRDHCIRTRQTAQTLGVMIVEILRVLRWRSPPISDILIPEGISHKGTPTICSLHHAGVLKRKWDKSVTMARQITGLIPNRKHVGGFKEEDCGDTGLREQSSNHQKKISLTHCRRE